MQELRDRTSFARLWTLYSAASYLGNKESRLKETIDAEGLEFHMLKKANSIVY